MKIELNDSRNDDQPYQNGQTHRKQHHDDSLQKQQPSSVPRIDTSLN